VTLEKAPADAPAFAETPPGSARQVSAGLSRAGLVIVLAGFALSNADVFIVNVALTSIGRGLMHTSDNVLELVVSGYGSTYALGLVLGGRLGDCLGRRRVFVYGVAGFTISSALCGLSPSIGLLVGARLLQGMAAALLVPQVLATIQAASAGEARARAIGYYGASAGLSAVAGQVLGGAILTLNVAGYGWRAVFMINVPIGMIILLLARRVPDTRAERKPGLDYIGTILLGLAMACLLIAVVEGGALGWPAWLWPLLAVAAAAMVALVRFERSSEARGSAPLLPPSILSRQSMRAGLLAVVPFSVGYGSLLFVYALVAQGNFKLDGIESGGVLVPFASAFFVTSFFTPKIAARLGRRIVSLGAACQGTAFLLLALVLGLTWPYVPLLPVLAVLAYLGIGQALVGPTLFRMILADVPASFAGTGSGVLATSQQMATALGAAVGGTLFLSTARAIGDDYASLVVIGLLTIFSVIVFRISLVLPQPT
jgi:MFS family permease